MPSLRIECYGVTVLQPINVQLSNLLLALFYGNSEVTVKFSQCYTDVTKVTVHLSIPQIQK